MIYQLIFTFSRRDGEEEDERKKKSQRPQNPTDPNPQNPTADNNPQSQKRKNLSFNQFQAKKIERDNERILKSLIDIQVGRSCYITQCGGVPHRPCYITQCGGVPTATPATYVYFGNLLLLQTLQSP